MASPCSVSSPLPSSPNPPPARARWSAALSRHGLNPPGHHPPPSLCQAGLPSLPTTSRRGPSSGPDTGWPSLTQYPAPPLPLSSLLFKVLEAIGGGQAGPITSKLGHCGLAAKQPCQRRIRRARRFRERVNDLPKVAQEEMTSNTAICSLSREAGMSLHVGWHFQ